MIEKINRFREKVPVVNQGIYMNHAAVSPMTAFHEEAFQQYFSKRSQLPVEFWPDALELKATFKKNVQRLIRAKKTENIAFSFNTSAGLNFFAGGYPFQPGDEILLTSIEFPANVYPFLMQEKKGVRVKIIPVNPEDEISLDVIKKHVTAKTKAISISYVQFINGYRADLQAIGEFCQGNDIIFIVDGIQGVGVAPIDVQNMHIDVLAVGGHKWLMWPMGTGFLYVSDPVLHKVEPLIAGWLSVKDSWNFFDYRLDFLDNAEKFEFATLNYPGMFIANRILEEFLSIGIDTIYSRVLSLTDLLIHHLQEMKIKILTPSGKNKRAGIVTISVPDAEMIFKKLNSKRIHISLRDGKLRFAPHFYNNEEEIQTVLSEIKQLISS
jgi:selenocysteine lyase/cysteine desulfurase